MEDHGGAWPFWMVRLVAWMQHVWIGGFGIPIRSYLDAQAVVGRWWDGRTENLRMDGWDARNPMDVINPRRGPSDFRLFRVGSKHPSMALFYCIFLMGFKTKSKALQEFTVYKLL